LYVDVESFYPKSIPDSCTDRAIVDMEVSFNSRSVESDYYVDQGHESLLI